MSSGLTASDSCEFSVAWADDSEVPLPNAQVGLESKESVSAYICPYCNSYSSRTVFYKVEYDESTQTYIKTSEEVTLSDETLSADFENHMVGDVPQVVDENSYSDHWYSVIYNEKSQSYIITNNTINPTILEEMVPLEDAIALSSSGEIYPVCEVYRRHFYYVSYDASRDVYIRSPMLISNGSSILSRLTLLGGLLTNAEDSDGNNMSIYTTEYGFDYYYKVALNEKTLQYEISDHTPVYLPDESLGKVGKYVEIDEDGEKYEVVTIGGQYYCRSCSVNEIESVYPVYDIYTAIDDDGNDIYICYTAKPYGLYTCHGLTTNGDNSNKIYEVYDGTNASGEGILFCCDNLTTINLVKDVSLSVYRREYDGKFTELQTGIENTGYTHVTDPHPSLDYARYRIVATSKTTGATSFYDAPGVLIGEKSIIIQWDEDWSVFDTNNEDAFEEPAWSGSLLRLPYNIDISDDHSPDVELVEYIGRNHPVSYYGTQLGESATWDVEIPKNDKDTLYGLRRLATYMGDCYVREPSGSGYWANVTVSFSQKHCEVTIPISLTLTRVEGGI